MQLRRSSTQALLCIAATALPLVASGCHHASKRQKKQQTSQAASSASGIQPAALQLDMSGVPRTKLVKPPPVAATLGLSLDELQKRWNEKAGENGAPKITHWQREPIPAFQAWRAVARLSPGLTLELVGIAKDQVQTADVTLAPLDNKDKKPLFDAWETLREAATPDISQDQLYKGLGLLSKPTTHIRYLDQGGFVWKVDYVALRPAPKARITLTVQRAMPEPDPANPFSMLVLIGGTANSGTIGSFSVQYDPASKGKTFEQAASYCDSQGLALCTNAQWQRACAQYMNMAKIPTWTSSFNKKMTKIDTRPGDGTCESKGSAKAKDKDPKRGALCCTRNVVMTGASNLALKGLFAMPVLMYEQAVNKKNWKEVGEVLGQKVSHFYSLDDITRADAIKFLQENAKKNPGQWSQYQSCDLNADPQKLHFLLKCGKTTFQGNQGMMSLTQFGVDRNHIAFVKDLKVLRKMGPI